MNVAPDTVASIWIYACSPTLKFSIISLETWTSYFNFSLAYLMIHSSPSDFTYKLSSYYYFIRGSYARCYPLWPLDDSDTMSILISVLLQGRYEPSDSHVCDNFYSSLLFQWDISLPPFSSEISPLPKPLYSLIGTTSPWYYFSCPLFTPHQSLPSQKIIAIQKSNSILCEITDEDEI